MHPRAQILALEDRRDAADHAAARVALHRLAGERLPDVGRVVVLQPLGELDDRLRAGAAGDRAVDGVDARVGLPERGEEGVERRRLGPRGPPGHDLELLRVRRGARRRVAAAGGQRQRERRDGAAAAAPRRPVTPHRPRAARAGRTRRAAVADGLAAGHARPGLQVVERVEPDDDEAARRGR